MNEIELNEYYECRQEGRCPFCRQEVEFTDFYDIISMKEYAISGLCQLCQDTIFEKS